VCLCAQAPKLPGRKVLGAMNPTFVDERRRGLEAYLQALIAIPGVWKCSQLVAFLDGPTQSLRDKVCLFDSSSWLLFLASHRATVCADDFADPNQVVDCKADGGWRRCVCRPIIVTILNVDGSWEQT
jgi:PX domain